MVALVLARRRWRNSAATRWPRRAATSTPTCVRSPSANRPPKSGRQGKGDGAQGRTGWTSRIGQVHDRATAGQGAQRHDARHRRGDRTADRTPHRRHFRDGRGEGVPRIEEEVVRAALAQHEGVLSLGGGAVSTPGVREALAGHTVVFLEISATEGVRRTGGSTVRPFWPGRTAPEVPRADVAACPAVPPSRHYRGQHQPSQSRRRRPLHRVAAARPATLARRRRPPWRRAPSSLIPTETESRAGPPPTLTPAALAGARGDEPGGWKSQPIR